MKAVFVPFNQAYKDRLLEIMDKMNIRGFTQWDAVMGRGSKLGEPHYGNHAWPTMNSAVIAMIDDEKVDRFLQTLHELDLQTESQGLHAFVWNIEKMI